LEVPRSFIKDAEPSGDHSYYHLRALFSVLLTSRTLQHHHIVAATLHHTLASASRLIARTISQ